MTLRAVRWLQQGKMIPFATVIVLTLLITVLFAVARERGLQSAAAADAPGLRASAPGAALAAGESITCIPTSAHVAGAAGTNWRTDLEVHNPGGTQASYSIALLKYAEANTSPTTQSFTLAPGQAVRYSDAVYERFAFNGKAALRVTATAGTVVVTSRTYNDQPGGSYGQSVPALPDGQAITAEQEGRLIQLSHQPSAAAGGFRTNLGVVNAGSGSIAVTIDLYTAAGAYLGQVPMALRGYEYLQIDKVFERVTGGVVADGYAVVRTSTSGGRFFAYASVIDNRTGDPVFIPAASRPRSAAPPTPTPTPTNPPGGTVNLTPYTPPGWANCVVCNSRQSSPPVYEVLYANQTTYVYWTIANFGTSTFTGPLKFGYYFDGARIFDLTWSNPDGLLPGYYQKFLPTTMTVYVTGQHTVEVRIDPDNAVAETIEADNSCSFTGYWGGAPLTLDAVGGAGVNAGIVAVPASPPLPIGGGADDDLGVRQAALATYYVPTSAHATGAAGTNWRTDLELHNPGTTQASYSIALLKHATDNSSSEGLSVTVGPGQALRYDDAVFALFGFNGKAALRVETISGSLVATTRTYNDQPAGTFGQFVPAIPDGESVTADREGRLIQLSHQPNATSGGFRTNVGVVNAGSGTIAVTIDLYAATGAYLGQVPMTLRAYEYQQIDKVFERVTASAVADGYAVVRTSTAGGRFFAYASVIDNRTGDPVFVPAANLPRGSAPPTPTPTPTTTPGVVTGPGGTSITLPSGGTTPNAPVTITAGSGSALPKSGETLVSTVIKVNVGGEGVSTGASSYIVKIPVTGTVSDPSKLELKVQTSVGPVYPVAGVYDSGTKVFTAEVMKLWDGWTMGVVTNSNLQVIAPSPEEAGDVHALGWVTPEDWQTCSWSISRELPPTSATTAYASEVKAALIAACQHLSAARFRSPKLWVDGRLNPKARVAHIVQGLGDSDPQTSFSQEVDEDNPAFSYITFNDAQMHSLGQLYFNWDGYLTVSQPNGWAVKNTVIHELLHGVQAGYDIRDKWWSSNSADALMWLAEGTSTVVGMTYQTNPNGINGGTVTVRPQTPPQNLSQVLQYWSGTAGYARQDFFAYFATRYNGGSFRDLSNLYQQLSNQTDGQFGKSAEEYRTLYRRGMNAHYSQNFNLTLPELYAEFAIDRAYRHNDAALLRTADRALVRNSLDPSLFLLVTQWDPSTTAVITEADAGHLNGLLPLQTWAIKVSVPQAARTAGTMTIPISVSGAPLSRQGVRILLFRENGGVLATNGEMEITDISQPVNVPVNSSIQTLTILVVNGSVEHTPAHVTLGQQPWTMVSHGYTEAHTCNNPPSCTNTCSAKSADPDPDYFPITWIGDYFYYEVPGHGKVEGKLSPDGQSMEYYRAVLEGGVVIRHFTNLPKITSRSSASLAVYGVSGAEALSHIATFKVCLWGEQGDYDLSKPLVLEAWLVK